ncbi:GEVED domain-containing protein [Streptococcus hyointestinalis]|uniref:CshA-like fibrillar surface protein C n=1 Tax=Streptococcus hyointestinalis TaxID=1337 RepID=A0A380K7S8_9STRE|nr:GEVED domain-containing protein [Streptococcus hyointestinalis]SUN61145.1 CshA-like fibrillar surface protein C [Streptococcus hyointestinalis]
MTDSTVRAHQFVIAQDGNEEEDLSLIVTDGLGTQVFGPVSNKQNTYSVPIVMSRNAENIGLYIMSTGMQRASIGFIVLDTGDAPDSYGSASHAITNAEELPYLGTLKPDADNYTSTTLEDETKVGSGWVLDDNINPVEDGKAAFADEDNLQLVGESEIHNGTELTLHRATDGTYQLSVLATAGETSGVAYVHGFIDFNNNGVFDEGEGSDIVETTNSEPGLVTLTWSDIPQSVDTSATQLGFRVRISSNAADIAEATGLAFTGEVEETTIQQTFPPRGSTSTTTGQKGETQTSQVTFTAYGQIDYDFTTVNTIDTSKVYKLVVDGNEVDDTTLTVAGQGTYTLNNTTGAVTFTPEADFVGTATGIVVRAWDKNGASTGWTADTATNGLENVQQIQTTYTMDAVYIPTVVAPTISGKDVTSTGLQNVTQTGTPTFTDSNGNAVAASATYPAKLVDSEGNLTDSITIDGEGTYTIDPSTGVVTFTPVETFTGVATGVTVQLETSVGTDKDGNAVPASATATYTPTVLATTPTIEDVNTAATTVTVGVPTESIGMVTSLEVTFPVSTNTDTSSTTSSTVSVTLTKGADGTWTDADGNTYTATTGTDGLTTFTVKVPATADLQATGDGYTTSPITVEASYTDGTNTTKASAKDVITNQAPVITTVTAVKEIEKGSSLTEADLAALFDGGSDKEDDTSTTDNKTSTVTYVITDASGSVVTPEQAAANPGNYTVTATITDSDGKTDTAVSVLVTKDTTAPTVDVADVRTDATDVTLTVSDDVTELTVNFPVSSNTDTSSSTSSTVAVTLTKNADGSYTGSDGNTYTTTANGDGTVSLTVKVPATADLQATGDGYTTSPITVTARDAAGNTATSTDIITNEAPVIAATVESTTLAQGDSVDVAAKFTSSDLEDDASTTDNKTSTVTYSLTVGDTVLTDEAAINAYISANPGTYTVVATITDSDGKTATASTVFTTEDKSAPVVAVEDVNTAATEVAVKVSSDSTKVEVNFPISTNTDTSSTTTGTTTVTLTKNTDGSYTGTDGNTYTPVDNGDGTVTLTVKVPADADLQATGDGYTTSPITATATDAAGNSNTSSDVISNEPPVITTVTPTTVIEKGSTPLTEAQIAALFDGGSDKEDDASTTDSKTSTVTYVMTDSEGNVVTPEQVAANPGDYTVTATITDSDGKSATATALITTKDTTSPRVAIENVSTAATEVAVTVSDDAEKADVTFPVSTNTGTTSTTTGTTTVTLTKNTDGSYTGTDGNTYTPVANGDGTVTLTVKVPADADLQATGDGYTTSPITATATDAAGNSTTSSDVITNTPPVIETTVPVTTITKGATIDVTSLFDGGSDKEDDASTTDSKTSTVTYTAVDASGNAVTASSVEELNSYISANPGTYVVTATITDSDGLTDTATATVVTNATTVTTFVDEDGNTVSPEEEGNQPKKDIDGYTYITTNVDEDGNVEHVYAKTKTVFVDTEGNTVSPEEKGNQPKKDIKDYTYVTTVTKDGVTTHIYTPVKVTKTTFVDEDGNTISPEEKGNQPKKDIDGYTYITTNVDEDGNAEHVYAKSKTVYVDTEGKELIPAEDGSQPKKEIDGYTYVTTVTTDGVTKHIYTPVTPEKTTVTTFVDEDGNTVSPEEEGNQPKKDIDGYTYITTNVDEDGNVEHVYAKTTTSYVDNNGDPIAPDEDGTQPNKDIPGYTYVTTKTEGGKTIHVYTKVTPETKTTTSYVDGDGNPVAPSEEGNQPKKDIDGYTYITTNVDKDGNVEHVYAKTTTSYVDNNGDPIAPDEEGTQTNKDIPGYTYVTTKTEGGKTIHVYTKVTPETKTTTSYVDGDGNPVAPSEEGNQPNKDIPGYKYVTTTVDKDGNVTHIYTKVEKATQTPQAAAATAKAASAQSDKALPKTGSDSGILATAIGSVLSALGLFGIGKGRKKDDD